MKKTKAMRIAFAIAIVNNRRILLLGVYKFVNVAPTTHNTCLQYIFTNLQSIIDQDEYDDTIIMGDFNIQNTKTTDAVISTMDSVCMQFNMLHVHPFLSTTVYNTCLDYVLCSNNKHLQIANHGVYPFEFSDHQMLFAQFNVT